MNIMSVLMLGISGVLEFIVLAKDDANEIVFGACSALEAIAFSISSSPYLKPEAALKCVAIAVELFIKQVYSAPLHLLNILTLLNLYETHFVPRLLTAVSCVSMPELVPLYFTDRIIQKYANYLDMKQRQSTFVFSSVIQGFVAVSAACCRFA